MKWHIKIVAISFIVFSPRFVNAQQLKKQLTLPPKIWMVPEGNNFNDTSSTYNFAYHAESPNIAAFWSKKFGKDPSLNHDPKTYFSIDSILQQCERFYEYYSDTLKFVDRGHSVSDKNKVLIFIFDKDDGTAYGGNSDDSLHVGILWTPPMRISRQPYGAVAHELGHVFQSFVSADGMVGFSTAGQSMYEMTSQYMLWQVYPNWLTFENYHLKAFLDLTYLSFLHEENMYHSPFVLEYWSEQHGKDFIGRLWRSAGKGEDAVMTYKRINNLTQEQFNDDMFNACRHFVNWNMPRIREVAKPYAHLHHTKLEKGSNGWYKIDSANCPQNYGYNAIALKVPDAGKEITLQFEGDTSLPGYRKVRSALAGWRYGFVVEDENGNTTYSPAYNKARAKIKYKMPAAAKYLWLVVMGAPKDHWVHKMDRKTENDEQWPYRFLVDGKGVEDH